MLLDEVHNYLAGLSPTLGLIVKGTMPATPDVCLSLFEYGGAPANMGFNVAGVQHEMPGLQVVTRGAPEDYVEPRNRIERAYQALAKIQGSTVQGTQYLMVKPQQAVFLLDRDESKRVRFVVNFLCEKEPSAA